MNYKEAVAAVVAQVMGIGVPFTAEKLATAVNQPHRHPRGLDGGGGGGGTIESDSVARMFIDPTTRQHDPTRVLDACLNDQLATVLRLEKTGKDNRDYVVTDIT